MIFMVCDNNSTGGQMFQIRNCLANALVAGALASTALLHAPAADAASETVVYSFKKSDKDGHQPSAGLIYVSGTLYGTTSEGGANGDGTVFMLNPKTGAEKVLYSFCSQASCADGSGPEAGLIDVNGTLYGTTPQGGANGGGTVFGIDLKTGAEAVIYSFCSKANCVDGSNPTAGLINISGILYGTTSEGGANGSGTVFGVNATVGVETVVYSFCSHDCWDGANPTAGLTDVGGTLYGTTSKGGFYFLNSGTVFKLDPTTGAESVVYSFCSHDCWDGAYPAAGLILANEALYGTTSKGGAYGLNSGIVFSVDAKTFVMKEVHAFGVGTDGAYPAAGLIDVSGALVGTTSGGGADGVGTVFALSLKTGAETVVHSFQDNGADGSHPYAGLINIDNTLYGTTSDGGAHGEGTVFEVTLP
jgi:uncharacterized repeat protein (TIGR03803 family)